MAEMWWGAPFLPQPRMRNMFFCLEIQPTSLPGQISSELKAVIPSRELSLPDTQIHASQRSYRMYQPLGVGEDPLHMCELQPDP